MTNPPFRFLMLGAMYENGGNTTQRLLDGHSKLAVYPYESQVGTRLVNDHLTSLFPQKYRWPVFSLNATAAEDFHAIIDEECKVRARTPHVSKFRDAPFDFDDEERKKIYQDYIATLGRSTGNNMEAFFRSTFDAWKDYNRSGSEEIYVGYSPIIGVDSGRILDDMPGAHVLHVVRNPWSAYADTKKRPVPMSLPAYVRAWTLNQYHAMAFSKLYPGRMHIVRFEDIASDPVAALTPLCEALDIALEDSLQKPSWNGQVLEEVYPWGTIRTPTPEVNRATAGELSAEEQQAVELWAQPYLEHFGYTDFLAS